MSVHGDINWSGHPIFLSEALAGESVALYELERGVHEIRFGTIVVGGLHDVPGRPVLWRALARHGARRSKAAA